MRVVRSSMKSSQSVVVPIGKPVKSSSSLFKICSCSELWLQLLKRFLTQCLSVGWSVSQNASSYQKCRSETTRSK